jgi:hypothetical protein
MMTIVGRVDTEAPRAGYALLTDVRDVLWQDDLFVRLRRSAGASGVGSGRPGTAAAPTRPGSPIGVGSLGEHDSEEEGREEPLFFAVEPFNGTVKDERLFNVPCASQCFPPSLMARYGHMPLSCAGTTAGTWTALQAYIHAMQAHTLFCTGAGKQLAFTGMDQPMHMYLLYDLILSRHPSHARALGKGHGHRHGGVEQRWTSLYGRLFSNDEAALTSYPLYPYRDAEPVYSTLRNVSLFSFDGWRGLGSVAGIEGQGALVHEPVRVVPLPMYHDEGAVCTLSLLPWDSFLVPDESGYGPSSDITPGGRHGAGPTCALVHQYDRHARLVKLVDVKYAGVDPAARYYDSTLNMTY